MDRRTFLTLFGAAGAAAMTATEATAQDSTDRLYYELRRYHVDTEAQRDALLAHLNDAMVPALNRLGIEPVGAFVHETDLSPVYVLLPHASLETLASVNTALLNDETYVNDGADFINAPAKTPAYARVESDILHAFTGMPGLARPATAEGRVFQLRVYESPSVKTGQKKIEMFNDGGEIAIFAKTGLKAVFFGEALFGEKLPNLTYMLAFDSMEEKDAAWKTFINDPEWKKLSAIPDYANDRILSNITNTFLHPAPASQL